MRSLWKARVRRLALGSKAPSLVCAILISLLVVAPAAAQSLVFWPSLDVVEEGGTARWWLSINGDSIPAQFTADYNTYDQFAIDRIRERCIGPGNPCSVYAYASFRRRVDVRWNPIEVTVVAQDTVFLPGVPGDTVFMPSPPDTVFLPADTVFLPPPVASDPNIQGITVSCLSGACDITWTLQAGAAGYVVWRLNSDPIDLLADAVQEVGFPDILALLYASPGDPVVTWTATDANGDRGTIFVNRVDTGTCAFPVVPTALPGSSFTCRVLGVPAGPNLFHLTQLDIVPDEPVDPPEPSDPPLPPPSPSNVTITREGNTVTAMWEGPPGITSYFAFWGDDDGTGSDSRAINSPSLVVTFTGGTGFFCVHSSLDGLLSEDYACNAIPAS